ncbi:MAG: hypothetical protein HRT38_00975 [Alteromonadaceae bacterium]|nr:hypothetical protein [Alteromonadaceae bacterium]
MSKGFSHTLILFILTLCLGEVKFADATETRLNKIRKKITGKVTQKELESKKITVDRTQDKTKLNTKLNTKEMPNNWINNFHETVSDSVYHSAYWFDQFFTNDDSEQQNPKTNARIKLAWAPKSRDFNEFKTRFRIKVKLPHFSNKVDLIFSEDNAEDLNNLPLESSNTKEHVDDERFTAAVRFVHKKQNDRLTDSRIGITGGDIFIRARHKRRYFWNEKHSLTIEPSIYYFLDDHLGEKLLLEYNYQRNNRQQLRINYSIRGSQSFSGIRWKHGLYQLNQLSDSKASILGFHVEGERNGKKGFIVDKYTLSYRYRFNALRKWLFFEIEPFVEWSENENYKTTPGIALRVEGYFYRG